MSKVTYSHLTVQPADADGSMEVWGQNEVTVPHLGTFDSDGIIGFLYHIGPFWVWLSEGGHPTAVFSSDELAGWLQSLAPSIDWAESYRQPEDRG